ncbi:hypothetical protein M422DRAFT_32719 [Sphaerobolus stellatus SS14]|uniref:Uncharacterized protein n=1 Tax=Sphaerobolus stellatus (strain SS14) TaxID=990650 RepID=A0A0C9VNX7_SPHS4|nr:hypothetical protein M422DRAFT_32719 [Sphaerobolus stellatus SS14]
MSRGGFGGGRGRGRGGRPSFPGGSNLPPMGLSFADLQNLSREPTALYPPMDPLPVLEPLTEDDKEDIRNQLVFEDVMRRSPYYIVEVKKNTDLPKYSDKYRPTAGSQPALKKSDLNPEFFPPGIFEAYFNPKKKRKVEKLKRKSLKANFDDLEKEEMEGGGGEDDDDDEDKEKDPDEAPDYDEDDEEDDNDYVDEYFDNGEGDDDDMLGPRGGGGDDMGGGGGDYYD